LYLQAAIQMLCVLGVIARPHDRIKSRAIGSGTKHWRLMPDCQYCTCAGQF
jgi:hypothetical protein